MVDAAEGKQKDIKVSYNNDLVTAIYSNPQWVGFVRVQALEASLSELKMESDSQAAQVADREVTVFGFKASMQLACLNMCVFFFVVASSRSVGTSSEELYDTAGHPKKT